MTLMAGHSSCAWRCAVADVTATGGLRHVVFFYQGGGDYRAAVTRFARAGLARKEPVLLAVPRPGLAFPDWPGGSSALMTIMDMADFGRNPARIIPAVRAFADRYFGQRAWIITESVWPADRRRKCVRLPGSMRSSTLRWPGCRPS